MNQIFKIISKIFGSLNSLVTKIDRKTADTIKNLYFFLIFVLSIVAIIVGYNIGKKQVTISSPPIYNTTNESFDILVKREKFKPQYNNIIDQDRFHDKEIEAMEKKRFPVNEQLEPDTQAGRVPPFESNNTMRSPLQDKDRLFDSTAQYDKPATTVKKLDRQYSAKKAFSDDIISTPKNSKALQPIPGKQTTEDRIRRIDSGSIKKKGNDILE